MSKRVLIVDDQQDAADSLAQLLTLLGCETRAAYDGPTALALADAFRPSVVLLDLVMPGMDGFAVVKQFRKRRPGCFIAAVTGSGRPDLVQRCLAEGFDCHLLKPIAPSDLLAILKSKPETATRS
jgi:CheY-like chemotaxis protein